MTAPLLLLLRPPLSSKSISVGQLLSDPLNPSSDPFIGASVPRTSASFDVLCQDSAARDLFHKAATRQQPLYYITGIRNSENPTFKSAAMEEEEEDSAPSRGYALPLHTRRDSGANVQDEQTTELIVGIEARRVKTMVGSVNEPHAPEDVDYSWTYITLDHVNSLQLSVGLGKTLVTNAELRAHAAIEGDDDDYFVEHEDSVDDSEEEGLGGFQ
ncbi:hypothetical protein K504DRAFT_365508 [Pleomassaria siparia CBS 279.74]|uniref:Uncharacterized protein n=1 Tax=Pleomassaria siparia CBS 279.74 TaxID=1314801 RepID=A0A6G1KR88_9PLEO|nr:hypothetical protein K504DRAFT_365508 [Pleomassaria siparia CBS 279.74]